MPPLPPKRTDTTFDAMGISPASASAGLVDVGVGAGGVGPIASGGNLIDMDLDEPGSPSAPAMGSIPFNGQGGRDPYEGLDAFGQMDDERYDDEQEQEREGRLGILGGGSNGKNGSGKKGIVDDDDY